MSKEKNIFIFPKIKNPSDSNFHSGGICKSGRSDDIINGSKKKTNMYFPYLEDLRKLIKEPQSNAKLLKPKSMHSQRLKNISEIQTLVKIQKQENFLRNQNISKSAHFQNACAQEKSKFSSKTALKKTLCKEALGEKMNDFDEAIKFPRINFLIDNMMSKMENNSGEKGDLCETDYNISTDKYENNLYNEKFLIASYKFFSYKQKNEIIKEQIEKKKQINANNVNNELEQPTKTLFSPKNEENKPIKNEISRERIYNPLGNHLSEVHLMKTGTNNPSNFF